MRLGLPSASHLRHNVVGYVALFVALGGTGAYATGDLTGANFQNETLTGSDVKGKSGNATTQAVNGTISGADIAGQAPNDNGQPFVAGTIKGWDVLDGSLKPDDIAADSLTAAELAPDSIRASEVETNSLGRDDYLEVYSFGARINNFVASGTQLGGVEGTSTATNSTSRWAMLSPNTRAARGDIGNARVRLSTPVASGATRTLGLRIGIFSVSFCTVHAGGQSCSGSSSGSFLVAAHSEWRLFSLTQGTPGPTDAVVTFDMTEEAQ